MENEDIFDRIAYIIEKEQLNIASFAKRIGSGDQTIRSIIKHRRNYPGYEVLQKIICAFEWVDATWLMTGKKKTYPTEQINDDAFYKSVILSQQKTIENLSESIKDSKKANAHPERDAGCAAAIG